MDMSSVISTPKTTGQISSTQLDTYSKKFRKSESGPAAMNAVCSGAVTKVALNRDVVAAVNHTYSVQLKENPATSQKHSGRCWMFAALNTLRTKAQEALNLEPGFELSQNYTMFWDKFEKSNYFLENILATLDEPEGSRLLDWLLQGPVQDGGQWDMFVNLVDKYGVVPKSVMPESESSSNTGQLCNYLTACLRAWGCELRSLAKTGQKVDSLRVRKEEIMSEVYRILCVHLGEPPKTFSLQWRDKDKEFHREATMTPQEFYATYIGVDLSQMVCLIHDPRPAHKTGKTYTVKFLGNVVGGRPTLYLNVDLNTVKNAAIAQLQKDESVWFGCDVGKHLNRDLGVMDLDIYNLEPLFGEAPTMSKAERLMYGDSQMTHAMVFTGVNLDEKGKPNRWRVENSWSAEPGDKGYFLMTDAWFDEFTYEVVVEKELLPQSLQEALNTSPVELEPWDPMGSLA